MGEVAQARSPRRLGLTPKVISMPTQHLRSALLALLFLSSTTGPSLAQEGQGAPNSSEAGPSDAGTQSSPKTEDKGTSDTRH